jgi:hypothetical protein
MVRFASLAFAIPLLLGPGWLPSSIAAQNLKLNGPLVRAFRTGFVTELLLSSDGRRVVYRADRSSQLDFELFSVPLDASSPSIRLNGPLPPDGDVGETNAYAAGLFKLGAGGLVVYRADQTTQGTFELYSVPLDGSASALRITPALLHVGAFWLVPAGDIVFYQVALHLLRPGLVRSGWPARRLQPRPVG